MDFIERIFGIAPDAGSGALEAMLVMLPVVVIATLFVYRRWRRTDWGGRGQS